MKAILTALLLTATTLFADVTNVVSLAWNVNPEPDISEYRIYYGPTGTTQTNSVGVNLNTTASLTNLTWATTYWFYVTAKNTYNLESDPSVIVTTSIPEQPQKPSTVQGLVVNVTLLSANQVLGPFEEKKEFRYEVEPEYFIVAVDINSPTNTAASPPIPEP